MLFDPKSVVVARSEGFHDLEAIAAEVRTLYFSGERSLPVQWGRNPARRRNRTSIRLGSYDHQSRLIRIHPSLNTALVPEWFIASIIHHEYLHHVLGPRHNSRFHKHERMFREYRQARQWLRRNLPFLLDRRGESRSGSRRRLSAPAPGVGQLSLF
jgi:hypothetical protein